MSGEWVRRTFHRAIAARAVRGRSSFRAAGCRTKGVDGEALRAHTIEAMRVSGIDPALVYAYERTHLIVTPDHRTARAVSAADLDEWDDALAEYRELHPHNHPRDN